MGRLLSDDVLAALSGLPAGKATRLEETLHALLRSMNRSAPEVATALGIHPQTARYRLRQLESLFGDRLDDPDFRFAASLVLHGRSLRPKR
jgi:DNA-binding PucR family transcriptional regulator